LWNAPRGGRSAGAARLSGVVTKDKPMLRIYAITLEVCADAADIAIAIARHDTDLARQLRRAAASIALNTAEGAGSQGKIRPTRYHTALGSARETLSCIEVAIAMKLIKRPDHSVIDRLNRVIGTLVKLARH